MNLYQRILAEFAPEMDALHMETLALAIGSTLNGMPREFFGEVAALARKMGADKLAAFHASQVV